MWQEAEQTSRPSSHTIFTVLSISDSTYVSSQPLPGFLRVCSKAWAISKTSGMASFCSGCSWQNRISFTSPSIRRTYRRGKTALRPVRTESFSPKSRHTRLRIKTPTGQEGKSHVWQIGDTLETRFSSENRPIPAGGLRKHSCSESAESTVRMKVGICEL